MASQLKLREREREREREVLASPIEGAREREREKEEMEEIRQAVDAYYMAGSEEVQQRAEEFFKSMDADGDKKVSLHEYLQFLREQGYTHLQNPNLFQELDRNNDGSLDFKEFLCLFYIIITGRRCCDGCAVFLKGLFFTCVECYDKGSSSSFNLCSECYRDRRFNHPHKGIIDNYLLLEKKRPESIFSQYTPARSTPSTSTQLVPARRYTSKREMTYKALMLYFTAASAANDGCSIL